MPLQSTIQKIEATLKSKPGTVVQSADRASMSITATREIINILFLGDKCHIIEYKERGTRKFPVYKAGAGMNAPTPAKMSKDEIRARNRKYYADQKKKQASEVNAKHQARIAEELARPAFRHPQDIAFFGEARV